MKAADDKIQWLLFRVTTAINSLEDMNTDVERVLSTYTGGSIALTIFDLEQIAAALKRSSFQPDNVLDTSSKDTKFLQYWVDRINGSEMMDWNSVLKCPLEEAASEILTLYKGSESNVKQDTTIYLQYYASEILRTACQTEQPALKQRLQQRKHELNHLQTSHAAVEQRYNASFDQWDDYCKNVLKVESDTLPLCPLNKYEDVVFDAYAKDIEKCVVESLRKEFDSLSERFVKGCHREDIVQAIGYCRSFTEFVSQQEVCNADSMLETLSQFITGNNISSCLSQFRTLPCVRVQLVSDLQQLEVFLSCRKRDIAAASSRGFGHNIAEAIGVEWTKFTIEKSTSKNTGLAPHDVDRFQHATCEVLQQIAGDGTQAKRLRLLSDTVGYSSTQQSPSTLYQKAAKLSCQMTLLDDQSKLLAQSVKKTKVYIEETEKELKAVENRVQYISERLNKNSHTK